MKASLTRNNHRDFQQRHQGTYGFLLVENKRILVNVTRVSSDRVDFVDVDKTPYHVFADGGVDFEFIPVRRGWVNGAAHPYYFARVPARQYQRGISHNNTEGLYLSAAGAGPVEISFSALDDAITKTISYEEAYAKYLKGERDAVALSKHFAMTPLVFYFYNRSVGTIKNDALILSEPMLAQEISDVFRKHDITKRIVV